MTTIRPPYLLLVATLCFGLIARADDKPSPVAKKIIDEAVREVRKNRQAFDKANDAPLAKAKSELQEWSAKLIKDGKAEDAKAVLEQIGTLEADVMRMANAPAVAGTVKQKPLMQRIAGKWTHPNHGTFYNLEPNGFFHETEKSDGRVFRQGQMQAMADGTLEVVASDGLQFKFREAGADTIAVEVWDSAGKPWNLGLVLTRIK